MPRKPRSAEIDSQATAISRAAWEIPEGRYSVQFRARIPKELAEGMALQSPADRGDRWADGVKVGESMPLILKAIEQLCPLESPSWIMDSNGVTVIWGEWSATADTQTQAVLLLLEAIFS